jgi:hypothetical protein
MTKRRFFLTSCLLCGVLAGSLSAAPISGSFRATGSFDVTTTDLFWLLPASERFTLTLGSGDFAAIPDNSIEVIHDLNITAQPVGSEIIPPFTFIEFITHPTLPPLLLKFIHPAVLPPGAPNSCGAAPAGGQFCVPPGIPGGSPFLLQNLDADTSIASFRLSGVTGANAFHAFGESSWTGVFTLPFNNRSFQAVLDDLVTTGAVSTSYSGDFTVTIVPEPGTFALIGIGLMTATIAVKRLKKKA